MSETQEALNKCLASTVKERAQTEECYNSPQLATFATATSTADRGAAQLNYNSPSSALTVNILHSLHYSTLHYITYIQHCMGAQSDHQFMTARTCSSSLSESLTLARSKYTGQSSEAHAVWCVRRPVQLMHISASCTCSFSTRRSRDIRIMPLRCGSRRHASQRPAEAFMSVSHMGQCAVR